MEKANVVREKSYQLALSVIQLVRANARRAEMFVLCNQVCRGRCKCGGGHCSIFKRGFCISDECGAKRGKRDALLVEII